MSPPDPRRSSPVDDDVPERNTVLLIVVGVLATVSVVVAALVIFSSGEGAAKKPDATATVRAGAQSLVVGRGAAGTVVVYEDFGSPQSREFEIASRDFLRIEAARDRVQVEYRPVASAGRGYSRDAFNAWAGVLASGTPRQALAFHDVLFDRQPQGSASAAHQFLAWAKDKGITDAKVLDALSTGDATLLAQADRAAAKAGVRTTPTVLLDGRPVTGSSPTAIADALQRKLLHQH